MCGKQIKADARFCRYCGFEYPNIVEQKLEPAKMQARVCGKCGNEIGEQAVFCRYCGAEIADVATANASIESNAVATANIRAGLNTEATANTSTGASPVANAGKGITMPTASTDTVTNARAEEKAGKNTGNNAATTFQAANVAKRNTKPKRKKSFLRVAFTFGFLALIVWGGYKIWDNREGILRTITGEETGKTPVSGYEGSTEANGTKAGHGPNSDGYQGEDEIGIITSIKYTEKEISSAKAQTVEVHVEDAVATIGDIYVDFGTMNLEDDCTLTVRKLPDKEDKDNGYSMVAWDFDIGEQDEFFIPVEVRLPYDKNTVGDPYFELVPQHYNEELGRWEDVEYEIDEDGYVILYTQHFSPIGISRKKTGEKIDITKAKVSFTSAQWTNTMRKCMSEEDFDRLYNGDLEIAKLQNVPDSWAMKAATNFGDISTAVGTGDSFFEFLFKETYRECTKHLGDFVSVLGFCYSSYNASSDIIKKIDAGNYGELGNYLYKEGPAMAVDGLSAISGAAQMAKTLGFISQASAGALSISPGLNCVAGGVLILKSYVDWKRERDAYNQVHFDEQGIYQWTYMRFTYANVMYDLEENDFEWGLTRYNIRKLNELKADSKTLEKFGLTVSDVDEMLKKGDSEKKLRKYGFGGHNVIKKLVDGGYFASGGYACIMEGIIKRNPEEAENWMQLFDIYINRLAKVYTTLSEKEVKIFEAIYERTEPDYPYWLSSPADYVDAAAFQLKYDLTAGKQNVYKEFMKLTKNGIWKENASILKAGKTYINRKVQINLYMTDEKGREITFKQSQKYKDKYIIIYSDPADRKVEEVEPWEADMNSTTLAESTFYGYLLWGTPSELRVYESKQKYQAGEKPLETHLIPKIKDGMNSVEVVFGKEAYEVKVDAKFTYENYFKVGMSPVEYKDLTAKIGADMLYVTLPECTVNSVTFPGGAGADTATEGSVSYSEMSFCINLMDFDLESSVKTDYGSRIRCLGYDIPDGFTFVKTDYGNEARSGTFQVGIRKNQGEVVLHYNKQGELSRVEMKLADDDGETISIEFIVMAR